MVLTNTIFIHSQLSVHLTEKEEKTLWKKSQRNRWFFKIWKLDLDCCRYSRVVSHMMDRHFLYFHTNFLASKNVFKCRICQAPITIKIHVCPKDHHNTREFVLSLVCLNLSSRYWKKVKIHNLEINRNWATVVVSYIYTVFYAQYNITEIYWGKEIIVSEMYNSIYKFFPVKNI